MEEGGPSPQGSVAPQPGERAVLQTQSRSSAVLRVGISAARGAAGCKGGSVRGKGAELGLAQAAIQRWQRPAASWAAGEAFSTGR